MALAFATRLALVRTPPPSPSATTRYGTNVVIAIGLGIFVLCAPAGLSQAQTRGIDKSRTSRLSASDGLHPHEFTTIGSVRELTDRRVLVTDERANEILIVDFATGTAANVGRRGSGPSEYGQVGRLWALSGDSTIMLDRANRRLLIIVGDRASGALPRDQISVLALLDEKLLGSDSLGRLVTIRNAISGAATAAHSDSVFVVRQRLFWPGRDTVARMAEHSANDAGMASAPSLAAASGSAIGRNSFSVGITVRTQAAAFRDGWIAVAQPVPYQITWCEPSARCAAVVVVPWQPRRMNRTEKATYLLTTGRSVGWPPTENPDEVGGWPMFVPSFASPPLRLDASALYAAPDGRLLVERFPTSGDSGTRYDLFNRSGSPIEMLFLQSNQHIVGFGNRSVYVCSVDDLGIQRLERHPWP